MFPRSVSELGQISLLAAVYFATAKLSLLLAVPPGYATAVWPPSGIALTAVLLVGTRIWPGIWLGAALANLSVQASPLLAVLIGTGNTLEAVVAGALIQRYAAGGPFGDGQQVLRFVVVCALSAAIAAGIGVASLALVQGISPPAALLNVWTWWQGDAFGMIVVTPLILSWRASEWPRWPLSKALEAVTLLTALALVTYLVFGSVPAPRLPLPLAFLPLPLVIWAAVRFTQREVTTAVAMVCGIAIWFTVNRSGPFGQWSTNNAMLLLLAYTSTLVMTGIALSAVTRARLQALTDLKEVKDRLATHVEDRTKELADANRMLRLELDERTRRESMLRESEERFRLLVDGVKDYAIFILDVNGNVSSWNKGAQAIKGYAASDIIGKHFSTFYTPEDLARHWPKHELSVARVEGRFEDEGWRVRKDGTRFWANVVITALYDDAGKMYGFAKVTRDLTARRHLEAMQETERQMHEFLAMLGHELRNPLAAIVNALALMHDDSGADHTQARNVVDRQVTHLSRLVDDLLDVSRITRGKITLKTEVIDLNVLVTQVAESIRPMIDRRRHQLEVRRAREPVMVDADPTRLSQVAINLVSNAAKYTPDGGHIVISVEREPNLAALRVRDNGVGIPPELLPRIFDLFVQGESSLARTEGGLGIGLTLSKRLVELQGGSLQGSSGGRGKGSEFIIRLPLAATPRDERAPVAEAAGAAPGGPKRLLVVDDNRDFATMLAALLELMGHEVRTAEDGPSAISVAADYRPDAVFLDIGLPGMSGFDVARRIRSSPDLARTTLIAFTGYSQDEDRRRVREAGFDHHLVKPADAAELSKIIDALPART